MTVLAQVAGLLAGGPVEVGGQDCHSASAGGAHTGDVSAAMLRDAGAAWVILGHSERRQAHGETDAVVRRKAVAAAEAGLVPIVCVGETEAQREAGQARTVVGAQLAGSLPPGFSGVVAYEPIWAIGTGRVPTAGDVSAMHAHIRRQLVTDLGDIGAGLRILYGGSVKPDNAAGLLSRGSGARWWEGRLVAEDFLSLGPAWPGIVYQSETG